MTSLGHLNEAIARLCAHLKSTEETRVTVIYVDEKSCFRQLCQCILGSQVPYEIAVAYTNRMAKRGLLLDLMATSRSAGMVDRIQSELYTAIELRDRQGRSTVRYRFPNAKARALLQAAQYFYGSGRSITELLDNAPSPEIARSILAREVPGLGPKQASLFLRSTGFSCDLAVIDSHVLTYLGLWTAQIPRYASSIKQYVKLEDMFKRIAQFFGYSVGIVDLAVWATMRVAARARNP
jgi:N-glycosylase/DNA lyase